MSVLQRVLEITRALPAVGDCVKKELENLNQPPELIDSEKSKIREYLIRFLITAGINCHKITCVWIPEQCELEISEIGIA